MDFRVMPSWLSQTDLQHHDSGSDSTLNILDAEQSSKPPNNSSRFVEPQDCIVN